MIEQIVHTMASDGHLTAVSFSLLVSGCLSPVPPAAWSCQERCSPFHFEVTLCCLAAWAPHLLDWPLSN